MSPSFDNFHNADVLNQLIEGNVEAFKWVYKKYFQKVQHFVYRYALSKEDTEEIVQDVFMQLWKKRASIDPHKNLDVLLYVISKNLVIDRIRKYVATEKQLHKYYESYPPDLNLNTTEQLVDFQEMKATIDQLVDALPEKRKLIYKLSREKGLTYKEIAELLNISQGTVEKQMSQALQFLKSALTDQHGITVNTLSLLILLLIL